jgi:PilZ domain
MERPSRRFLPRFNLQLPLRFQPANQSGPEWTGHSTNISMHGAYVVADFAPPVGELVRILIELPEEIGMRAAEYCFTAKIIHLETDRPEMGKVGFGVKFLYYLFADEIESKETGKPQSVRSSTNWKSGYRPRRSVIEMKRV